MENLQTEKPVLDRPAVEKPKVDPVLKAKVDELIRAQGGGFNEDLVEDIVITALKLLKDVEHRGDVRVIQTAVRELRYAFKMFAPSRARWTKASFTSSYFLTRRSFTSINSTGCSIAAPDSTKHSDRI